MQRALPRRMLGAALAGSILVPGGTAAPVGVRHTEGLVRGVAAGLPALDAVTCERPAAGAAMLRLGWPLDRPCHPLLINPVERAPSAGVYAGDSHRRFGVRVVDSGFPRTTMY